MDNSVNSPAHYKRGGMECIDAIRAMLTPENLKGYYKGNILKYLWRLEDKRNPPEDARKMLVYANWLAIQLEKEARQREEEIPF